MAKKIPFFELFKNLELSRGLHIALSDAEIRSAELNRKDRSMALDMTTTCELGERAMEELRQAVAAAYGLERVTVRLTVEARCQGEGGGDLRRTGPGKGAVHGGP